MLEAEESTVTKDGYKKTKFGLLPKDWEIIQFNEVFELMKSYSFSRNDLTDNENEGDTYYIHYGDIHSKFERLILNLNDRNSAKIPLLRDSSKPEKDLVYLQEGDLIIADASEDYEGVAECIEIGEITEGKKLISGLHTIVARDKNGKTAKKFRSHLLKNWPVAKELKKIATGISVLGVSKTNLGKVKIPLPPFNQQKIIAEILTTWDQAISKTEKLIKAKKRYKKALMQRLLSGKVRFPEFEGEDWVEVKLGEVFDRITNKNESESVKNVLTISAQDGLVSQTDYYNKSVASKDLSNYIVLRKGDFAYNKSYSEGYPLGAIKRLDDYEKGVLSPLYICFRLTLDNVDSDFIAHFFEYGGLDHGIYKIAREGARNHGLLNVSVKDFFEIDLTIPQCDEQKRIASVLNEAMKEIELLESQLEKYQQQKKGLMQQLLTGKVRVKS